MMRQALGITRDGVVGPPSIGLILSSSLIKHKVIRRDGYHDLVRRRTKDERFLRGWLLRIDRFIYQGGGQPPAVVGDSGDIIADFALAIAAYVTLK